MSDLSEYGVDQGILDEVYKARKKELAPCFIEQELVDDASSGTPMDEKLAIAEEKAEAYMNSQQLVVRGAMLRCTCGTHCRRLNLPESHNSYMEGRPYMNELDCISGDKTICKDSEQNKLINISYFGVCNGNSDGDSIVLAADVPRDPFGNEIKETGGKKESCLSKATNNVSGRACVPNVSTHWFNPDTGTVVDGAHAITVGSFLVRQFGGIIEVLQSGQSMSDNMDEDALAENIESEEKAQE